MHLKVVYDNASDMQGCLLRLVQKSSLYISYDSYANDKLLFCGEELQTLSGYAIEELQELPDNWLSIIHPDDQNEIVTARRVLLQQEQSETEHTYRIITKNNKIRLLRERACVDNTTGTRQTITAIITDITQDVNKLAEEHLIESEARYRSLFEHSPVGMLIIDIDETKKAIASNPKWTEFMKTDKDTIMNANMIEFSPDFQPDGQRSSKKLSNILATYRDKRTSTSFEWQFKDKEDVLRDMQVKLYPITVDGKQQTIMFTNDITQLKEIERALRKALDKAKESDNLKSAFMANFSHEIRTPMNSIIGFSQLLALPDLSEEERQHFLQLIQHNGDELLNLIEKILEISRIESKQLNLNYEEIKPIEICQLVYHSNKTAAVNKNIDLKFDFKASDISAWIYTDRAKLLLILNRLLGNAIKFTTEGSVHFWYQATDNEIEFIIQDTGKGIPKAMGDAVFQSFRQLEDPNTKEFSGLGLGLPITKGYVTALGGKIWFESIENKGSTFHVLLPLGIHNKVL